MIDTLPNTEMFRTAAITRDVQGVDREGKRILGAAVMQLGSVNDDRPWDIDEEALSALVAAGNSNAKGLKARFTHPNMSGDGLGHYLGRWSNFRQDGDRVRADLQFADVAFKSPRGDLATYLMDLAEEDPEAFGVSAALRLDTAAMGKLKKDGRTKLRFQAVKALDTVDEPASTRTGMFACDLSDPRDVPEVVTQFLDANFSGATPEVVRSRLDGLLSRYFEMRGLSMADPKTPTPEPIPTPEPQPTPTPEPAPEPKPMPSDDLSAQLATERNRVKGIHAVCSMAKVPQSKVNEFIDNGADLATVNLFCAQHLSASNKPVDDDASTVDDDPDAKLKAEYREHAKLIADMGSEPVSEELYIKSRKRAG